MHLYVPAGSLAPSASEVRGYLQEGKSAKLSLREKQCEQRSTLFSFKVDAVRAAAHSAMRRTAGAR